MSWWLKIPIAIAIALLVYLISAWSLRLFNTAPAATPDPDDVVPVDLQFECIVCGAKVTMTAAPMEGDLDAPRHCREDMVLVGTGGYGGDSV
ncbi:MAG: hypothetical protein WBD02_07960 [Acidimicrobiia bacterium]